MKPLIAPFTAHPRSVGESYWEHMGVSLSFAGTMLLAAGAALVHAVLPFLFVRTGSGIIDRLHQRMVAQRARR
ncbi:DUF6356 family protein [Ramlibacter sp. XY19]|uniref:DUF6356 family protein n=1 Tax=Ramlibacter paludis TaxID=2908000 RepID=UPI0023DAE5E9|nr:DUF6356 family protein [Ramlibacter paludis]MCG2594505.1 DUF6356 family protein [Ramlibacter paludis]